MFLALVATCVGFGCGGDTTVIQQTTTSTTTTTAVSDDTVSGPTTTAPEKPKKPQSTDSVTFQTPSGNIGCVMATKFVRCDIYERDWSPPPKPASCEYDWGHSVELEQDGPTFLCVSDAVTAPGGDSGFPTLAYDDTKRVGPFTCLSTEQAMKCQATSGHGFTLSRQKVRLY